MCEISALGVSSEKLIRDQMELSDMASNVQTRAIIRFRVLFSKGRVGWRNSGGDKLPRHGRAFPLSKFWGRATGASMDYDNALDTSTKSHASLVPFTHPVVSSRIVILWQIVQLSACGG